MGRIKNQESRIRKLKRFVVILLLLPTAYFLLPAPSASAVNGMFECWCRDETTRICDHFRIDSGIDVAAGVWPFGPYYGDAFRIDGSFAHPASVKTFVDGMELTPTRKEELKGLCQARCAADGGKTSINYETTYREAICEECNADPNSSCTEERGARLAAGQAQTDLLIAKCEDRESQSLLPIHLAVPIGGINQVNGLPDYINLAYRYLVTVVLIVAIVMVVYGGFRYLVGASIGDIQAGKKIIIDAIVGMLIVLGAYTILSTINPATTILSFKTPEPIECKDLDLPDAVKNARCTSDSSCPSGQRCVEGRDYLYSQKNVARMEQEGGEKGADVGAEVGQTVAGFIGDGSNGLVAAAAGGAVGCAPCAVLGVVSYLLPTSWVERVGSAAGTVAGGATGLVAGSAVGTIVEVRRASENIKVCSTLEQGAPCLTDQSCRAPLKCILSWSICWADSGNEPGQPCDNDDQCSNRSCVAVEPAGVLTPGTPNPSYPYKVCEIQVSDGTPCFRSNHGQSATVFPIQCNGIPGPGEFTCAWCPSGEGGGARNWAYLSRGLPFPAQCKPRDALETPCAP